MTHDAFKSWLEAKYAEAVRKYQNADLKMRQTPTQETVHNASEFCGRMRALKEVLDKLEGEKIDPGLPFDVGYI